MPGDVRKTDAESGCRDELARLRSNQANFAAEQRPVSIPGVPEGALRVGSAPNRAIRKLEHLSGKIGKTGKLPR